MFQYAAGRALSLHKEVPLRVDVSGFVNYDLHQGFELQRIFNCAIDIASKDDVHGILGWQSSSTIRRYLSRASLSPFRRNGFVVEPHFNYWAGFDEAPEDSYLVGYWQSEQYFRDVSEIISSDFTFKLPLSAQNMMLAEQINHVNAVSLHVRRGDYANNPLTTATHGLCSLEYYQAAVRHIAEKVEAPYFFIFSDDVGWVKENIRIGFPCHYVDHNQRAESYNDMRLMSLCKHHIIANSSFSWWGAWLNRRAEKIVIAPKRWFANNNDTKDLYAQGWITL